MSILLNLLFARLQTRRTGDRRSLFDPWNIRAIRFIRGDPSTLQRRMKNSAEDSGRYKRRVFESGKKGIEEN
jgi:hypothetical protein